MQDKPLCYHGGLKRLTKTVVPYDIEETKTVDTWVCVCDEGWKGKCCQEKIDTQDPGRKFLKDLSSE